MSKVMWVGIDVSKHTFYAALAGELAAPREWAALPAASFEHSRQGMERFVAWVDELGGQDAVAGVCIEATGRYSHQWIGLLRGRLAPVSVVNPALPKAYAKSLGVRDKSDRVDACILALYGKATRPRPTPTEPPAQRELRELSRLRHALHEQRKANEQRLADGPSCSTARQTLKKTIAALARQVRNIEQAIDALIHGDPSLAADFKRATTVKGIGGTTAAILLAEFGDLRRYNRDELVALAGLYPREHTSGSSVRKGPRLIHAGKPQVRAALYMCAMSALRSDPRVGAFARRLRANGKRPMQVIVAVMRKLLLIVHAVIVTGADYDPRYPNTLHSQPA